MARPRMNDSRLLLLVAGGSAAAIGIGWLIGRGSVPPESAQSTVNPVGTPTGMTAGEANVPPPGYTTIPIGLPAPAAAPAPPAGPPGAPKLPGPIGPLTGLDPKAAGVLAVLLDSRVKVLDPTLLDQYAALVALAPQDPTNVAILAQIKDKAARIRAGAA